MPSPKPTPPPAGCSATLLQTPNLAPSFQLQLNGRSHGGTPHLIVDPSEAMDGAQVSVVPSADALGSRQQFDAILCDLADIEQRRLDRYTIKTLIVESSLN